MVLWIHMHTHTHIHTRRDEQRIKQQKLTTTTNQIRIDTQISINYFLGNRGISFALAPTGERIEMNEWAEKNAWSPNFSLRIAWLTHNLWILVDVDWCSAFLAFARQSFFTIAKNGKQKNAVFCGSTHEPIWKTIHSEILASLTSTQNSTNDATKQ